MQPVFGRTAGIFSRRTDHRSRRKIDTPVHAGAHRCSYANSSPYAYSLTDTHRRTYADARAHSHPDF